jgi:hypothetical protein
MFHAAGPQRSELAPPARSVRKVLRPYGRASSGAGRSMSTVFRHRQTWFITGDTRRTLGRRSSSTLEEKSSSPCEAGNREGAGYDRQWMDHGAANSAQSSHIAPVAQWIEQRFPKPRALVRFRAGALRRHGSDAVCACWTSAGGTETATQATGSCLSGSASPMSARASPANREGSAF